MLTVLALMKKPPGPATLCAPDSPVSGMNPGYFVAVVASQAGFEPATRCLEGCYGVPALHFCTNGGASTLAGSIFSIPGNCRLSRQDQSVYHLSHLRDEVDGTIHYAWVYW